MKEMKVAYAVVSEPLNDVPSFREDPQGTAGMLPDLGVEERAVAVGGLLLHRVSADLLSSSYGLDHHCRAIQMNTAWCRWCWWGG